jgi:hypothetical protein
MSKEQFYDRGAAGIVSHPTSRLGLGQGHLMTAMNEAAPVFLARYTRPDGSFVWRQTWPGMDGSDDGYESYHNWPLFFALGGDADLYRCSHVLWDAVTRQSPTTDRSGASSTSRVP